MSKEEQWELSVSLVMVSALSARACLFTVFILGSAFVEALALIGFVVSLIVK